MTTETRALAGQARENERRAKARFEIRRELRYKVLKDGLVVASGAGQTHNMGSGGVAFTPDGELHPGAFIELSISWPVLLDDRCPMRLIAFGRIVRSDRRKVACTIDKYEFRTQARTYQLPVRNDSMLQRWADSWTRETMKMRAGA
jgi:hypothetical protein